jgi:ring-1,2-phenylacetyl-CoA epoxidase subunit PaaC
VSSKDSLLSYVLRLADNALVIGQRLVERVAGEPELEEELANANFALDYIGQARMLYTYAGELEGKRRGEDDFAYLRDSQEFCNLLLLEQPNGNFADGIARQFLFEVFYLEQLRALETCNDARLAEIAARAIKEIRYHLRHATHWILRLGDGTTESHDRVQAALDALWRYTGEMFSGDDVDMCVEQEYNGPKLAEIEKAWRLQVANVVAEATLTLPDTPSLAGGGRNGQHSEHLGYLIAEMQHLQRAYPGASW